MKNSVVTKYYFAGTTRLAVRTNGTLKYLLADHLGSTTLSTDANGTVSAAALYKAFGELRSTPSALGTDYKFTGQREEASLGMYFFVARWFDPSLGRFTSPDTIVPTSTQGTQAWDRYAFVNNNPVRYNDPTGHELQDGEGVQSCNDSSALNDGAKEPCKYPEPEENGHEDDCVGTNSEGGFSCSIELSLDEARELRDALELGLRIAQGIVIVGLAGIGAAAGIGVPGAMIGALVGVILAFAIDDVYSGAIDEIDRALEFRSEDATSITLEISRDSYNGEISMNGFGAETSTIGSAALADIFRLLGISNIPINEVPAYPSQPH